MDISVMEHPGEWYAQVLYRGNGHTYTSEKLMFMVNDITKGMN